MVKIQNNGSSATMELTTTVPHGSIPSYTESSASLKRGLSSICIILHLFHSFSFYALCTNCLHQTSTPSVQNKKICANWNSLSCSREARRTDFGSWHSPSESVHRKQKWPSAEDRLATVLQDVGFGISKIRLQDHSSFTQSKISISIFWYILSRQLKRAFPASSFNPKGKNLVDTAHIDTKMEICAIQAETLCSELWPMCCWLVQTLVTVGNCRQWHAVPVGHTKQGHPMDSAATRVQFHSCFSIFMCK